MAIFPVLQKLTHMCGKDERALMLLNNFVDENYKTDNT